MAKRLTYQQKKEQAIVDLINKMFEIAGHSVTYDDIKDREDDWYTQWTISVVENEEWMRWGREYLIKNLKLYPKIAEREMQIISLMWGLKFSDFPNVN
jgi:hypothetical protein